MYWLDTSPGMRHAPLDGGPVHGHRQVPRSAAGVDARRRAATSASCSGPNGRRRSGGVTVDRHRIAAERRQRGHEPRRGAGQGGVQHGACPPASAGCVPVTRPVAVEAATSSAERSRGSRASPPCRRRRERCASRSCPRPAPRTPAPGWRSTSSRERATTASITDSSGSRTERRHQTSGVTDGLKPRAISPPRNSSLVAASTSTTATPRLLSPCARPRSWRC